VQTGIPGELPNRSEYGALSPSSRARGRPLLAERARDLVARKLECFPWPIRYQDWTGRSCALGCDAPHWCGEPFEITIKTEAAAKTLLAYDAMGFLEKYLQGEVDLDGNLYVLSDLRGYAGFDLRALQAIPLLFLHRAYQTISRARVSVKSHYDIPQEALDVYLDRSYRAYSCGMFEAPRWLERAELLRIGSGQGDCFDSLEKAQWRKFQDAIDFIAPEEGDTLLDVGCGYGGQLAVALESHRFRSYVGWTHSSNQVREGSKLLSRFERDRWELCEGDYRCEDRVFDHVTSTGMISHVGPHGLAPYVRNIRKRIKTGGRYLHHSLMKVYSGVPLDFQIGPVFHKKYVWPGFHWFTVGAHAKALERNGFEVQRMLNLSEHYAKTTAAWYERMMTQKDAMIARLGEPTFRAWRLYLAGSSGNFSNKGIHVYRLYCEAV
jgi:cyclopropane-fatty-acyl-phospholipid synthase